jgi:hypothetical protein
MQYHRHNLNILSGVSLIQANPKQRFVKGTRIGSRARTGKPPSQYGNSLTKENQPPKKVPELRTTRAFNQTLSSSETKPIPLEWALHRVNKN